MEGMAGGKPTTHVLIFPCPFQGHVNSMLKLSELLLLSNLHITFLNTQHIQERLLRYTDIGARFAPYMPKFFQLKTISDGLPADHPRDREPDVLITSMAIETKPMLRKMLVSEEVVDCIIADGPFASFTGEVARELGIPIIYFRTISASCVLSYLAVPNLIKTAQLPILGKEDMDRQITGVPCMENFRCRDLPSFCRASNPEDPTLQFLVHETQQSCQSSGLILNTFENLEGHVLSHLCDHHFPNIYPIGPIHLHLKIRQEAKTSSSEKLPPAGGSLFEVDNSCMTWLEFQPLRSVLYVSFGSITPMLWDEIKEFWYGLVNSKQRFLWAMRPELMRVKEDNKDQTPRELVEGTQERGRIVGWAPQEEVLAHEAIGGFLTHSGWNSTLESIGAGVPMICYPYFADQQVNSRCVGEVWKIGVDMKDACKREVVTKMVRDVMVERKEEFRKSAKEMGKMARESLNEGRSSYHHFDRLVKDIKMFGEVGKAH